eukprot:m51a1_g30 hypothetical protein (521) ;mRNA; r:124313-126194
MGKKPLSGVEVFCYGVGHFLNDMTAGLWFSFLLIFLTEVAKLDAAHAGSVMLAGQVADAIATPLVGWASDHTNIRWGRRKVWVLGGAVLVNLSFFFVFNRCWLCESTGINETVWFATLASIFNVGWAALQVAHMALVPDLTSDEHQSTRLNSARYAGCIAATLAVLLITTVSFNRLGLSYGAFSITSISAIVLGDIMTVVFLIGVREPSQSQSHSDAAARGSQRRSRSSSLSSSSFREVKQHGWPAWFKKLSFYQVAFVYMLSRISVNLSQVYMPFYLRRSLGLVSHADVLAEVPAVIMVVSFATTMAMRSLNAKIGRLACYAFGALLSTLGCGALFVILPGFWWSVFVFAILIGIGSTSLLVTAVSMEADLVDKQVKTGAFVYGFMSFTDKIGNGILIKFMAPYTEDDRDLRYLNALLPSSAALLGLLFVMSMPFYWRQLAAKFRSKDRDATPAVEDYCAEPSIIGSIHNSLNGRDFLREVEAAEAQAEAESLLPSGRQGEMVPPGCSSVQCERDPLLP